MMWPFRRKRSRDPSRSDLQPPGEGWRRWFEVSTTAACNVPWDHEWVELWRPDWDRPRLARASDVPYQLNGEDFWWRPSPQAPETGKRAAAPPDWNRG